MIVLLSFFVYRKLTQKNQVSQSVYVVKGIRGKGLDDR